MYLSRYSHHPASQMRDPLMELFMRDETARLRELTAKLCMDNAALGGTPNAFRYNSRIYHAIPLRDIHRTSVKQIDTTLEDRAAHLEHVTEIFERDTKRLTQGITVVLSRCTTSQDVRDALPEELVQISPELSTLPRTRPEGYVLEEHPMLRKQFEATMELALYYTANRLIFS